MTNISCMCTSFGMHASYRDPFILIDSLIQTVMSTYFEL